MTTSHQARKRFGQHFLHDRGVIQRIVDLVDPQLEDHVIEIGPGLGAITRPLLERCRRLEVIELDRDVIPHLERRCEGVGELVIHRQDALTVDFAALRCDTRPLRLVGNLPYNISAPLLFHVLASAEHLRDMHFMLQKEVVERMAAGPGEPDYGRLSVMLQYRCRVIPLFEIGPGAFDPPPKVDSAVVRLVPHAQPPVEVLDAARFEELVRRAFAQRRKTLRNNLRGLLDAQAIDATGVDPGRRPETLSLEEFARLANRVGVPPKSSS